MRRTLAVSSLCWSLLAGCTPAYVYSPTGLATAPPKPSDCGFEVTEAVPRRPFDEIGVLAPKDIEYGDMAGGNNSFFEAVRAQVCAAGGDVVVVEKGQFGRFVRGTVLRYR